LFSLANTQRVGLLPPPPDDVPPSGETVWDTLDRLGLALQQCEQVQAQVRLVLTAVRESLGADAVYWHPGSTGEDLEREGFVDLPEIWCREFTRRVLAEAVGPPAQVLRTFLDPGAKLMSPWPCSAALVRVNKAASSWLVVLSFHPRRLFQSTDLKVLMLARRMVLTHRQQTQGSEKWRESLLALLRCLSSAVETRHPLAAGHSQRVAEIAVRLAEQMGLSPAARRDLYLAGVFHDVGKIGVRDSVLAKAGPLSPEEIAHVQQHALFGDEILARLPLLQQIRPGVRHHHERFDGTGYPDRLAGQDIPLAARILAVADACDALLAERPHRPAQTPAQLEAILIDGAGSQWDPLVVRHFLACRQEIYTIAQRRKG
jgi:response regulator RpfG family c-di-GMP phosphodiesterase